MSEKDIPLIILIDTASPVLEVNEHPREDKAEILLNEQEIHSGFKICQYCWLICRKLTADKYKSSTPTDFDDDLTCREIIPKDNHEVS